MASNKPTTPLRIIAIPDAHAKPNINQDRFVWLGKLIADYKPTTLINIGDLFDLPSLCSYDRGTKGFEGRCYHKDIAAGVEALNIIKKTVLRTKWGKQHYEEVDKHFCLGNHEARINRVPRLPPNMRGCSVMMISDSKIMAIVFIHILKQWILAEFSSPTISYPFTYNDQAPWLGTANAPQSRRQA